MQRQKTHSGAKKRVRRLKSNKIKAAHTRRRKFLVKKSSRNKRALRMGMYLSSPDTKRLLPLLP